MSEGTTPPTNNNPRRDQPTDDQSASSIFLELMRQQATHPQDDDGYPDALAPHPLAAMDGAVPDGSALVEDEHDAALDEPVNPESLGSHDEPDAHSDIRERLRVQRVQRRRKRRRYQTFGVMGGAFRTVFTLVITAVTTATIFTWWQGPEFLSADVRDDLSIALATATNQGMMVQATALPVTPNWLKRVGIISGHRGPENDPGAVCDDGLTEAEINLAVAQRVVRNLQARGYTVDLLDEFDPRLADYRAEALISIHANTCRDYGEVVSGYLISTADARSGSGNDQLLVECVAAKYEDSAQLLRRYGLTRDVTDYHVFREIHPRTPGAIIELGFMLADRAILTQQPDLLADGITQGILCYLEPESPNILATLQAPTPAPPDAPTPLPISSN